MIVIELFQPNYSVLTHLTTEAGSFTMFSQTRGNLFNLHFICQDIKHPAPARTRLRESSTCTARHNPPPSPSPVPASIHTLIEVKRKLQAHAEEGLAAGALQHVTLHVGPAILGTNQGRQLVRFACPLQRVLVLRIKPNKLQVKQSTLWPGFIWPKKSL